MINNILYTTKNHLCTGCGICEDVCPKKAIQIRRLNGEHRPELNQNLCLGSKCGKCLKVCPGVGFDLMKKAKEQYVDESVKTDKYIGRYVALHTGYSCDDEVRFHGASGGIVTQFLIFLLERKIIDGAVVTGFGKDKITPVSYIARTKDEIITARSSKYCPVALNRVGNEIAKTEGKYVIVGLPCHIQGFRKRADIDITFRKRIVGYFSIYCSSNRTFNAQDYLLKKYAIQKEQIEYFAYRDNGCLGNMVIETNAPQGEFPSRTNIKNSACRESKLISIPYTHYYRRLRSFFKPHRCLTCIDHYGELADVCFGDIHITPYSEDKVGISSWIVRNEYWEKLFIESVKDGYLKMDDVDAFTLNESQKVMLYPKKRRAKAAMNLDKVLGLHTPSYDKEFGEKVTLEDYVSEVVCHIQRFIGRNKKLWWLIKLGE